jgi:heme/copper-type cytochrome/quinol oxidase subunit 2
MVKRSVILGVVIVAVLAVSAGYFVNGVSSGGSNGSVTINLVVLPGLNATSVDTYNVRAFTVTRGEHVTLVVQNSDDDPHELYIPAFNLDTGIVPSGQTVRLSFVPSKAGVFDWYEPPGLCGNCTGKQEMTGNMTVLP